MRQLVARAGLGQRIAVDSAGAQDYHVGEAPDPRSAAVAARHGYPLDGLVARQVQAEDFHTFDLLLGLDSGHLARLQRLCPPSMRHKPVLFLEYAGMEGIKDVPDPYYGGEQDFQRAFDLILAGCEGVLRQVKVASFENVGS